MKRMFLLLVFCCSVFGCGGGSSPTSSSGSTTTYIAMGDSITSGGEWLAYLNSFLQSGGQSIEIVNAGVAGACSADGVTALSGVFARNPDFISIAYGVNDALNANGPDETERNYRTMVARILSESEATVLVHTLTPVCGFRVASGQAGRIEEANQRIRGIIAEYRSNPRVVGVDVATAFANAGGCELIEAVSNNMSGVLNHPTTKGYRLYAEIVWAALRPLLD